MAEKISAVYKIINTVTNDFYIGSSKDVKRRWKEHKCKSIWKKCPNNLLYQDMQKYGIDKFEFEILAEVEIEQLKITEQKFIEELKPAYNNINANGLDTERRKEYQKSERFKESQRKASRKYYKSEKGKKAHRKYQKEHHNQICCYNGEILTLNALSTRFQRAGIPHPTIEAKKYLLNK